jgi:hypothetical protein
VWGNIAAACVEWWALLNETEKMHVLKVWGSIMSMQRSVHGGAVPIREVSDCFIRRFDAHGEPFIMRGIWAAQQQPAPPPMHLMPLPTNQGWLPCDLKFMQGYNHNQHYNQNQLNFLSEIPKNGHNLQQQQQQQQDQLLRQSQECRLQQKQTKQPRRAKELNVLSSSFESKNKPLQIQNLPAPAVDKTAEDQQLSGRSTPTRPDHPPGPPSPVTEIAIRMEGGLGIALHDSVSHEPKHFSTGLSASAPAFVPAFGVSSNSNGAGEVGGNMALTPTRRSSSSQNFITPTHKSQQQTNNALHEQPEEQENQEHQSPTLKILHSQFIEEYVTRSPEADPAAPWLTYECDSVRQAMQQFIGAEGEIAEARLAEGTGKQMEVPHQVGKSKEVFKRMRALEQQGLPAVQEFCMASLPLLPGLEIKMMSELADFAKRIGCVKEAREVFAQMRSLQPGSQHAWLESAKMEEELGYIEQCEELLLQGLMQCPQSDSILLKAVKLQEKLGNMRMARSLLSRMKLIPVERAWRVILEGALLETRAGNLTVARKVFKYLIKSVPWYGPIYCDMCAVHERECDWLRAEKIVACGLTNIPRYGPLWLCAMRVCERKFMLPANGKPLPNAAQLVCDQTRKIATQALQLMGSKELVWKLLMQAAQCEARAGLIDCWRSAVASAALSVPENLRWKVWSAAAKLELACGEASLCMPLLERALQVSLEFCI